MNSSRKRGIPLPRLALAVLAAAWVTLAAEDPSDPWIDRFEPFGAGAGSECAVALFGRNLTVPATVVFDSPHLTWETDALHSDGALRGTVRLSRDAPPGPHIATLVTPLGRSNSRIFYVDELPSSSEGEPNDTLAQSQSIKLRALTLHGGMHSLSDVDIFSFEAAAGERWTFDLRSIEYGGFLENNMSLLDESGKRIAFSDDRDDYLETPFLEHTFQRSGKYFLKLDQYRGPQRVNCNKNCGYMLRIGQIPIVDAAFPLGARPGQQVEVSLRGRALEEVESVWLVPVRRAEYYRLTFPFTIPVSPDPRPSTRIEGEIERRGERRLSAMFAIPADAWRGLWRLWVRSSGGSADSISLEISDMPEPDCREIRPAPRGAACNGVLEGDRSEHEFALTLGAGQPLAVTTLSAQLGVPQLDTVLELFDADGNLVAEHDDLMSGQGTVIGNPDSMLVYKPDAAGRFRLVVRDRIGRTGPDMAYRLRVEEREPGFSLLSDPENLNVRAGATERVGVLLVPEPGYDDAVSVWIADPPPGISAEPSRFRGGRFFGPSGDGDNIVIPEAFIHVRVDPGVPPGDYPLRVLGRAEAGGATVAALSTLWIGPPRKRNDVRRPVEYVRLTVLDPSPQHEGEPELSGGSR